MTDRTTARLAAMALSHATGARTDTAMPRFAIWSSPGPNEVTPALFVPKF